MLIKIESVYKRNVYESDEDFSEISVKKTHVFSATQYIVTEYKRLSSNEFKNLYDHLMDINYDGVVYVIGKDILDTLDKDSEKNISTVHITDCSGDSVVVIILEGYMQVLNEKSEVISELDVNY